MPDPRHLSPDVMRDHMAHYPVDTFCHYEPGAELEPRFYHVAQWIPDGVTVMDIGCNTGGMGWRLLAERTGVVMLGVEPNPGLAAQAITRGYTQVTVGLIQDVTHLLPLADIVLGMNPLDYCIDLDECLRAMLVPLKPGGVIINEGVHRNSRWGDWHSHGDLTRSWWPDTARELFEKYVEVLDVIEGGVASNEREWVYVRGRKR